MSGMNQRIRTVTGAIAIGCCVLIAGCVTTDWKAAQQLNSLEAYAEFLAKHPASEFTNKAQESIKAIKESEAVAALTRADMTRTEQAFKNVAAEYPETSAGREAAAAIKRLVHPADLRKDVADKWASDWRSFVPLFQPYFDRGQITAAEKLQLDKSMHGTLVTWSGTVKSITNGCVTLTMPYASLRFNVVSQASYGGPSTTNTSTYDADTLIVTPGWKNRNAWIKTRVGESVRFRTALVGPCIGSIWFGAGRYAGTIIVEWDTDDAELVETGGELGSLDN